MVTDVLLRIERSKVIGTEVLVRFGVAKHVINRDQQAVLDRAYSAIFSTAARQTMILRFEIAVLFAHRRMGRAYPEFCV